MGGGAAGMTAAIFAAERGAGVLLLEHMEQIGKKILVTGNGKCNYTNRMQEVSHYRGDEPAFVMSAFAQFGFIQKKRTDISIRRVNRPLRFWK